MTTATNLPIPGMAALERVELDLEPARVLPLGEPDTIERGNRAHRHLDVEAGVEYLHTSAYVCTDTYERPRTEWADPDARRDALNSLAAHAETVDYEDTHGAQE